MKRLLVTLTPLLFASSSWALNLEEYLSQVSNKHKTVQSLKESQSAAAHRREAAEVGYSPILQMKISETQDKNPQIMGPFTTSNVKQTEYSLGLAKTFHTGTTGSVAFGAAQISADSTSALSTPATTTSSSYGKSSFSLGVSQSLWKNSFGEASRLKSLRDTVTMNLEQQSYDLQSKQILIEAEAAYWDYLYLKEELSQRKNSLARAERIEAWIKRRVGNGIGDDADLYNAQGLTAARQLQLLTTQDDLSAAETKIRDLLELSKEEALPSLTGELGMSRKLVAMTAGAPNGKKVRLDAYLSALEAKIKAIASQEVDDGYKPDLVFEGLYKTNASESSVSEATGHTFETNKSTTNVALKLNWILDPDIKSAARHSARADALAATLKQERKYLEGESSWSEILRRHSELSKKIKAAEVLSMLQEKKAAAERDKLSKGRSITSQVITAEQDAAETLLTLTKMRAEQRKLEANARLYVSIEE